MPSVFIQNKNPVSLRKRAVVTDRANARDVLAELLRRRKVDESLRIKSMDGRVFIPVRDGSDISGNMGLSEEEFEKRFFHSSPQSRIKRELEARGLATDGAPEKWTRFGSSVLIRLPEMDEGARHEFASVYAAVLRSSSVYNITGRVRGQFREPEVELVYGPGGDVAHTENGIRFNFDPAKIMFSPGNVNIRTSVREMDLDGKTVIDMFAGIGYFSLGIARYSRPARVHACEINPTSYGYLVRNIAANKLGDVIQPHLGDSRMVSPEIKADAIIMGNFLSFSYLPHALRRIRPGGIILLHDTVSSDMLAVYKYALYRRIGMHGWKGAVLEQKTVKSFAPHMWHIYVRVVVSDNRH